LFHYHVLVCLVFHFLLLFLSQLLIHGGTVKSPETYWQDFASSWLACRNRAKSEQKFALQLISFNVFVKLTRERPLDYCCRVSKRFENKCKILHTFRVINERILVFILQQVKEADFHLHHLAIQFHEIAPKDLFVHQLTSNDFDYARRQKEEHIEDCILVATAAKLSLGCILFADIAHGFLLETRDFLFCRRKAHWRYTSSGFVAD
jgi:hypothetical protein